MYDPLLHFPLRERTSFQSLAGSNGAAHPFELRFHASISWIKTLFFQLYGHRPDAEEQFWILVDDLFQGFKDRPEHLKHQDLEREQDPFWLMSEKWVGMMMYVDRFSGDLKGFEEKIPYLKRLGINWIHLMPLLKSPAGSNDGGYAVSDYRAVDSKFGTLDELTDLLDSFREQGILSTLDLVMNHTSDEHEWAIKARAGEQKYKDFYYFYQDREIPDRFEQSMPEIFPHSSPGNFTYLSDLKEYVMSVFHHYQWDLNYTNPEVFREMLKVLLYLSNLGVDILRLDAVAFTWKEIGTDCQNLPQAHIILQLMKACAQVVAPGTAFIAEAIVAPQEVVKYFGEGPAWGKECEIAYHATFMASLWDALATGEVNLLKKGLNGIPRKPQRTTWINYLRCHDDIGLGFADQHLYELGKDPYSHKKFLIDFYTGTFAGSTAKGAPFASNPKTGDARISGSMAALTGLENAREKDDPRLIDQAIRKILMLNGIILSYGGLPLLYYGDELGTGNNYDYLNDPDQAYDNRWMHRPVMDWNQAEKVNDEGSPEQKLYDGTRLLIALRKSSPEFADMNSCSVEDSGNQHVFSFLRWNQEGARTFVLSNFTDHQQAIPLWSVRNCGLNPEELIDKITGLPLTIEEENILIDPIRTIWATEKTTFAAFQEGEEVKEVREEGSWPVATS